MSQLASCPSCRGFVPQAAVACPHCAASLAPKGRLRSLRRGLLTLAGTGVAAVTLMACYGGPTEIGERCYPEDPESWCYQPGDAGAGVDGGLEADAGTDGGETDAGD